jgi:hypothetical protein
VRGKDSFLDGFDVGKRDAVRLIFADEKMLAQETSLNPDVAESERIDPLRELSLEALVRMSLTGFRDNDRVCVRDLIEVELVDAALIKRFSPELGQRLQSLLDTPNG